MKLGTDLMDPLNQSERSLSEKDSQTGPPLGENYPALYEINIDDDVDDDDDDGDDDEV